MTDVFVICNQQGHFWGKKKMWVDGSEPKVLLRVKNRDEASNTLFELSSKDFELRGEIVEVELSPKGDPIVQVSDIPLPILPQEEETTLDETEAAEPADAENTLGESPAQEPIDEQAVSVEGQQ